jgi:S1-C subfamily serine protease
VRALTPPRPRLRPAAAALVATWAIVAGLLVQQAHEIVRLRREATEATSSLDERLSTLRGSQASLQTQVDGLFDPTEVVGEALPAVFMLTAGPYQGSAFVLASDAAGSTLVTNFHVVRSLWTAGARHVSVRAEGRSFNGTVVQVRPDADIAVVEVDATLPTLGTDTSTLDVGEPIVVIGSPYGFGGSASTGIVSAVRGRYVQFSAPVSPGSSGGPVLDGDGQVVAVTTAKVVGHGVEGLSFGIPIETVCRQTAAC